MTKMDNLKKVSLIGIICNIVLLIIKLTAGVISNSTAVIADAIHSIEDAFCSVLSYIGVKISSKKIDELHPYGYGKAEYVFSLIISVTMIFASFSIVQTIIEGIISKSNVKFSFWLIIICVVNIFIKFLLYLYTKFKYQETEDILIKASMEDHRNDMTLTTSTLIGVICGYFEIQIMDTAAGIVTFSWILYIGVKLFLSSYKVLIDTGIENNISQNLSLELKKYEVGVKITKLIFKPIGDTYILILKIHVEQGTNLKETLEIMERLKNETYNKYSYISDVIADIT